MLQWMGGSRRKVATSRKSTQKRQKQYFEQRKRQQQNLQMVGSDNRDESSSGQSLKEHRSLDILNLLNLSKNAQECNYFYPKGRDDGDVSSAMPGSVSTNQPRMFSKVEAIVNSCGFEEEKAEAPLCCQIETSPKKVSVSSPDHQNTAFNGSSSHWKTVTDQYSELSVIDLLCDDEPNPTEEKSPTCEDHVSFSLEGLGKVGIETPVHSPLQRARSPYRNSPLLKGGRKTKLKNLNHVLDDIELEVDAMMQDIRVSPVNSSNFPSNKVKRSSATDGDCKHFYDHTDKIGSSNSEELFWKTENNENIWNAKKSSAIDGDCKHFYDHTDKNGPSISGEFFCKTENNENIWNVGSIFHDAKFDKEMGYDTSCKKTLQMGRESPELLKSGAYKMESYAFEDLLPTKWSSAMEEINMEPLASFSTDQLEDEFDFYGASRARLHGKFNGQNLIPEDVRDNSSLLSEESTSSTAARGGSVMRSPSRIVTGENRRKHRNAFASPRNKCSTNEAKSRSLPNPPKRKSSHYSNSILQEEMGVHNSWQFEERYASVDRSFVSTSFCQDLEANFSVFGCKNRAEDPFSTFTTPELHKASPSFGGYKNAATLGESPPCSFASEKFAFDCLTEFPNFRSWPTGPSLSPDFHFREGPQDTGGFHCETSSTDMSVQGSVSKGERKVKLQKDRHTNFEQEENIFMGDDDLSSEKKMAGDAPISDDLAQECEGTEDTNPKTTQCLETADSPVHVEEISSSLKKPDKHERNCDAETPLKCNITNEEMKICPPEGRNMVAGKHDNDQICLSGQVMFEGYVLQLLRVQKVVKEACTTSRRNNAFLGPGSNIISHQA